MGFTMHWTTFTNKVEIWKCEWLTNLLTDAYASEKTTQKTSKTKINAVVWIILIACTDCWKKLSWEEVYSVVVNTHFPCPYFYILVIDDDGGDDDDDQKAKGKRPSDAATNIEGVPAQSQGQPHNPIIFFKSNIYPGDFTWTSFSVDALGFDKDLDLLHKFHWGNQTPSTKTFLFHLQGLCFKRHNV